VDAAARWADLVRDRMAEVGRLRSGGSTVSAAAWKERERRFAAELAAPAAGRDPFLSRVRRATSSSSTVIDVGAGPGRHAVPLARRVRTVTAVDPSAETLAHLRRRASEESITNIACVTGRWEDVDVDVADVVLSAFVVTLVEDAPTFIAKLDRCARRRVFLYLSAFSADALHDPFWRHFHGAPRVPAPTYLDALAVVRDLGIDPSVDIVEIPDRRRFATVAAAAGEYRDHLVLPDTRAARHELEGLLSSWLVRRDGALAAPLRAVPAAIISWAPSGPRNP
jgi:SAM-dependent methyltransferase